ncbi:GtrA family protein [Granulicatella sp. zg-ZJ]|uniref:GtrA family protein n=1 Tax=unclassified Granulicatella TaxID=2630493 RepID=UPI0013BF92FF|nr:MULTISPECIES: GtrA family protein [unclassified Granulicatella]MBS4749975.1 GtrA family protein [Carnobacteriaceae bacterium zg-ZUI78]NEW62029.1 GtrA family protein [Granulicatella sp. zg-ZJ]NEW66173.1 GtrA family protein [Granulicatella sp. zg-84]QMI86070.1 GtrA family protein [Carnobacteriaceae bacterium zg-84]
MVKYIFFGALTTGVNFLSLWVFKTYTVLPLILSNFLSIVLSILFAYFVNAKYVFYSKAQTTKQICQELGKFFSARVITIIVELVGVWLLAEVLLYSLMYSKLFVNIIVLILNFIFSKVIFK